jgi:glycosyltransferase involved in cell wall biosynthesis
MISRHPVIFTLTDADWDYPWWLDRQHLMSRLAVRGWSIIYSTGPLAIWERKDRAWKTAGWLASTELAFKKQCQKGKVMIDRAGRLLPLWPRFSAWDMFIHRIYSKRLVRLSGGTLPENRIAFVCYPSFLPYVRTLNPRWVVLHINDAWWEQPFWTSVLDAQLEELVERADLITCIADSMARGLPKDGARKARIIPHGVDAGAIIAGAAQPCPEDLARIPRPRIGYLGRVSRKVDLALVSDVARRRSDWHWVFVGDAGVGFGNDESSWDALRMCRELPNVHFLSSKTRQALPAYLSHMDVNVLCYKVSQRGFWTVGSPLKLYEYFAAGKPIVGSDLENIRMHKDALAVATTPEEWIQAIKSALEDGGVGSVEMRQKLALENTWDSRTNLLETWLHQMIGY